MWGRWWSGWWGERVFNKKIIDGKSANEWFQLGVKATDPTKEVEYYTKSLEIDPRSITAWNNKGSALDELGRYEDVITCYDIATEIDPVYAAVLCFKAVSLDKSKKYEKLMKYFDRASTIDPKYTFAGNEKIYA